MRLTEATAVAPGMDCASRTRPFGSTSRWTPSVQRWLTAPSLHDPQHPRFGAPPDEGLGVGERNDDSGVVPASPGLGCHVFREGDQRLTVLTHFELQQDFVPGTAEEIPIQGGYLMGVEATVLALHAGHFGHQGAEELQLIG